MVNKYFIVTLYCAVCVACTTVLTEATNKTEITDAHKKIGLHTGVVTANGWNSGGSSTSYVTGVGVQAGIVNRDGSYKPLYNQAFQGGRTYQTGLHPPDSFGIVTSEIRPGTVGGSVYGDVENADKKDVYTYQYKSGSLQPQSDGSYLWSGLKSDKESKVAPQQII